MEQFERSNEDASSYPVNLMQSDVPALYRKSILNELRSQAARLFCADEGTADVKLLCRFVKDRGQYKRDQHSVSELTTLSDLELKRIRNIDALHKALWSPIDRPEFKASLTMA